MVYTRDSLSVSFTLTPLTLIRVQLRINLVSRSTYRELSDPKPQHVQLCLTRATLNPAWDVCL